MFSFRLSLRGYTVRPSGFIFFPVGPFGLPVWEGSPFFTGGVMTNTYLYEFPTSGFARVDTVRHWLEDQPEWDFATSEQFSQAYQIAAMELFHFTPTSLNAEQRALNTYLTAAKAGKMMTIYAWGLYTDLQEAAEPERLI